MTFDQAFQKLQKTFPGKHVSLEYHRDSSASFITGYVEGIGWSDDFTKIQDVIDQLSGLEVKPDVEAPEVA